MLSLMLTLVAQVQELPNVPKPSAAALSHASPTPSMTWRSTAPAAVLRAQAAAELGRAIERSPGNAQAWPDLRAAAVLAATTLGAESQNAARITRAVLAADEKEARKESKAALSDLSAELGLVSRDLVFAPLVESPRPLGFPEATVVGEFEVLAYPPYRMARAAMPRSLFGQQNSAFWKLFRHIQSHDIPMTAPVEMSWGESEGEQSEAGRAYETMAFLYVSTDVGRTGPDGEVDVLDVPAATVVSVGVRGASGEQRVREQRERLRAWIEARPDRFEIVGPPRMMGWNSPMVPDAKRYWEVQFPVRVLEPAPSRAK